MSVGPVQDLAFPSVLGRALIPQLPNPLRSIGFEDLLLSTLRQYHLELEMLMTSTRPICGTDLSIPRVDG